MPAVSYSITFLYYRQIEQAGDFYRDVLGFEIRKDMGWCKIFNITPTACVGLVDETRGTLKASADKPVMLSLFVDDVDEWHRRVTERGVAAEQPSVGPRSGLYGFFFQDPEGYTIEVLSA